MHVAERQPSKVEPASNVEDPTGEVSWPIGSLPAKVRWVIITHDVSNRASIWEQQQQAAQAVPMLATLGLKQLL